MAFYRKIQEVKERRRNLEKKKIAEKEKKYSVGYEVLEMGVYQNGRKKPINLTFAKNGIRITFQSVHERSVVLPGIEGNHEHQEGSN